MLKPAIPANERQRLKTLRDLKLLDTPPEERFDRVTRLAKQYSGPKSLWSAWSTPTGNGSSLARASTPKKRPGISLSAAMQSSVTRFSS